MKKNHWPRGRLGLEKIVFMLFSKEKRNRIILKLQRIILEKKTPLANLKKWTSEYAPWTATRGQNVNKYRKVASSRPVYYSILDSFAQSK